MSASKYSSVGWNYVPLSVREGDWRKKAGLWLLIRREEVALFIAPWLRGVVADIRRRRFEEDV